MSLPVTVRSRARIDILEQFYYYGESADLRTANRFLAAVERTASLATCHTIPNVRRAREINPRACTGIGARKAR